jgi:hypothetical protein
MTMESLVIRRLDQVFGVSKDPVLSYTQRDAVDDSFIAALAADKQIVVYGASKQGKTALVRRYLPYEENIGDTSRNGDLCTFAESRCNVLNRLAGQRQRIAPCPKNGAFST